MSKFKIGDRVKVLSIPGVYSEAESEIMFNTFPSLTGRKTVIDVGGGYSYNLDGSDFTFHDESLEMIQPAAMSDSGHKTMIGLETEIHSLELKVQSLKQELEAMQLKEQE